MERETIVRAPRAPPHRSFILSPFTHTHPTVFFWNVPFFFGDGALSFSSFPPLGDHPPSSSFLAPLPLPKTKGAGAPRLMV
jgi:hypothetical protein